MTDINSLPIDDGSCENDELVNNLLNDLNDNKETDQNSDDILRELSDAPDDDYEEYEEYEEDEVSQQGGNLNPQELLEQFKVPLIIMVLAFLVNSEFAENFILNIPFFGGDGKLNIFGFILKAVLVGGLFFVIDKYVI